MDTTVDIHRRPGLIEGLGRDTAYVLLQFPLGIASFVAMVTGISLSAGLMILVIGLPVLVLVLGIARLFAVIQRELVAVRGHDAIEPGLYRRSSETWWERWLGTIRTPQPWLDVLHGLVTFPIAVATFVVTTVWWSVTLGGLTFWIWERWLPERDHPDNESLPELLNWDVPEWTLFLAMGLVAAASLPYVMRLCGAVHEGLARLLLDNGRVRELEQQVRELDAAREAAAQAEVRELRRLERDLHDGPQQRLVRLGMDLAVAERRLATDPESAQAILAEARIQAADTLSELRALSRGIAPPILADRGLEAALVAMAARSPIPAEIGVDLGGQTDLPEPVETAMYFAMSEAVANVVKHSGATQAVVAVRREGGELVGEVVDDGAGGAVLIPEHGLAGLAERVGAQGGSLEVDSPTGGPTRVTVRIPCGS